MVTRCYLCGGKTVKKTVTAENWWGDKLTWWKMFPPGYARTAVKNTLTPKRAAPWTP